MTWYTWLLKFFTASKPGDVDPGTERRYRCRGCSEIEAFHADPTENTLCVLKCSRCGTYNRLHIPVGTKESLPEANPTDTK